jgi:hypothetical protein
MRPIPVIACTIASAIGSTVFPNELPFYGPSPESGISVLSTDERAVSFDGHRGLGDWVKSTDGPGHAEDAGSAVAVDSAGYVYSTGYSTGTNGEFDYLTVKYSPSGGIVWSARYDGPGHSGDMAKGIAVDGAGNVYVTGGSLSTGGNVDFATIKYDANGNQLWVARFDGAAQCYDMAQKVRVDASGNVYVAGISSGVNSGWDYLVVKYSSSGTKLWAARYDGPAHCDDTMSDFRIDGSGNSYITGSSLNASGYSDIATLKYSATGTQLWVKVISASAGLLFRGNARGNALVLDTSGNVLVAGSTFASSYTGGHFNFSEDFITVKYGGDGTLKWSARYDGPQFHEDDSAYAIATDSTGNVYVSGASDRWCVTTIKYGPTGNFLWQLQTEENMWYARPVGMKLDSAGNLYVGGYGGSGLDFTAWKFTSGGQLLWTKRYDGPVHGADWAYGMAVDALGNVYITGGSDISGMGSDTHYQDFTTLKWVHD